MHVKYACMRNFLAQITRARPVVDDLALDDALVIDLVPADGAAGAARRVRVPVVADARVQVVVVAVPAVAVLALPLDLAGAAAAVAPPDLVGYVD